MDDKITGLYAASLTVRDIRAHLEDVYGLKVAPDLISKVIDADLDEVREWQSRALERRYPIVIFDALRVKIRDTDSCMVRNKAIYVALGKCLPVRIGRESYKSLCNQAPATKIKPDEIHAFNSALTGAFCVLNTSAKSPRVIRTCCSKS